MAENAGTVPKTDASAPAGPDGDGTAPGREALARLVERVGNQDRQAFAMLFEHFAPRLKSFYLGRGVAEGAAEDLVQETMLVLWQRAAHYCAQKAAASTWIFTIARNLCVDRIRRERRYDPETPPEDALTASADVPDAMAETRPEDAAVAEQRHAALREALSGLPEEQREVIDLHYRQWMTTGDIARTKSVSQGTVKSRMRLALRRLRDELETS